jgi:Ca2+-binding RTX toxin-like protein
MYGGQNNDSHNAGDGSNFAQGNMGDDTVTGGAGADAIYGNRGADTYSTSDSLSELLDRSLDEPLF